MLPNNAAMKFNDTQCIGYLLGALRHEPRWETVTSAITSSQLRGKATFRQVCDELRFRCEADKAYELLDKQVAGKRKVQGLAAKVISDETPEILPPVNDEVKAFISSMSKRLNKTPDQDTKWDDKKGGRTKKVYKKRECIAKCCTTQSTFPLCGLHYHSLVSGKSDSVELRNDWGNASFNAETNTMVYPSKVPPNLLPTPKPPKKQ